MKDKRIELKSCPCCGGEASLVHTPYPINNGVYYVYCKECLIRTRPRRNKDTVIETWNRRVNENE